MPQKPHSIPPEKLNDCLDLYIKYKGRDHERIELEMRAKGWTTFRRTVLYDRRVRRTLRAGWISRFGWDKIVETGPSRPTRRGVSRRHDFELWLRAAEPHWTWNWPHQIHLYEKLHRVTLGKCKRLMIFMPPRHGKSELVTVRYAAYRLFNDPALNIIIGSYNQKLANRFSRKIRNVLSESDVRNAERGVRNLKEVRNADCGLRNEEKAEATNQHEKTRNKKTIQNPHSAIRIPQSINTVAEWETRAGGGVRAVGVGAGITGYGAKLVIIDDPVKSRAEAESETYRDNCWDWFNDDIYTRLEPNAAIILIQTRWHEDDLAGRLLRQMEDGDGEHWDVVSLPALAESGELRNADCGMRNEEKSVTTNQHEIARNKKTIQNPQSAFRIPQSLDPLGRREGQALCPDRFNEEALHKIKRQLGSYSFASLYQQRPQPIEGGLFKRKWFKRIVDKAPENLQWARAYDLAVSTKTSADFTASFRCAFDRSDGTLYISGGFRRRIEFPEQRRYVIERMKAEPNTRHGIEAALHGQAFVQDLRREAQLLGVPLQSVRADADKFTRALSWANLAEDGKVVLVQSAGFSPLCDESHTLNTPWIEDFLDEACRFTGRSTHHDDQIDAISLAVQMLAKNNKLYRF